MRNIVVLTGARSDLNYLAPVLERLENPRLIVTGMHLSPEFGYTVRDVEKRGFEIAARVEMLLSSDTPVGVAKSMSLAMSGLADAYARLDPDLLLILGDRFETLAGASAFLPFARPIAHIAGGETTEGAIDESIRHALTKMSHLHFVATRQYGETVEQMGEEPWRIHVTGAPSLDVMAATRPVPREELERRIGIPLDPAPLLVTFHPTTLELDRTEHDVAELLAALDALAMPVVFTYPNADMNGRLIIHAIEQYVATHPNARAVANFGEAFYTMLRHAAAMVGNSSSGIIEAATFALPVVDIGNRQRGRVRGPNVLWSAPSRADITAATRHAISPEFRNSIQGMLNPYGDGHASEKIAKVLREVDLDERLMIKRFWRR